MPRRKKRAVELTDEELMKKLFPKAARDEVKKTALDSQKKPTKSKSK